MKRLYRSRRDRVLLGVCGGIARYFGVDPVLVRLIWLLVSLGPFPGILGYLVAAILMPEEPPETGPTTPPGGPAAAGGEPAADERQRERSLRLLGWGLVAAGVVFLLYNWSMMAGMQHMLRRYLPFPPWNFWWGLSASWWPVLLIVLGAVILWRGLRRSV